VDVSLTKSETTGFAGVSDIFLKGHVMAQPPSKFTKFMLQFRSKDIAEDLRKLGINLITAAFIGIFIAKDSKLSLGLLVAIVIGFLVWLGGLYLEPQAEEESE